MDFSTYIFRSHYMGTIVSPTKGLTANQSVTLAQIEAKMKAGNTITANQRKLYHELTVKQLSSKDVGLTDTAKKFLTKIVFFEKCGRKLSTENKYFSKGIEVEKAGRDLLSKVLGMPLVQDGERKANGWVTGVRDVKSKDYIIDIKNAYSFETFNNHLLEKESTPYIRQTDCYMDLWDIPTAIIAYTLIDTPFALVSKELYYLMVNSDVADLTGAIRDEGVDRVKELITDHIFTRKGLEGFCNENSNVKVEWFDDFREIPESERVHLVINNYSKERIEERNASLVKAREFMGGVTPKNRYTI